ncbi:MAG: hypothetical protein U5R48_09315 [Gammaproteobacteria bacterium]|nr:hypothetical protein [Gammaproteobacteria bacterium]
MELLRQAWAAFRDHEVAAHLGEALWVRGDREEARKIWVRGLDLSQETDVLIETIERLLGADGVRAASFPWAHGNRRHSLDRAVVDLRGRRSRRETPGVAAGSG